MTTAPLAKTVAATIRMKMSKSLLAVASALLLGGTSFAQGRYYSLLHHFAGGASDGARPQGSLTLSGTTLYGMTFAGGSGNAGTIFRINTDGTGFALLHAFDGSSADGASPYGSPTLDGTVLYGMTSAGGSYGLGTVFKINTDGTGFTVLHAFAGGTVDGSKPYGLLTLSGTALYGMTSGGGVYDWGTVFRINTDGTGFALLHGFGGSGADGGKPCGSLTLSGSALYGEGVNLENNGNVVFTINTDGTGFKVLDRGSGMVLVTPNYYASLTISGSTLYGTTAGNGGGGTGAWGGTVFSLQTDGSNYRSLVAFQGLGGTWPDGENPQWSLILSGSTLYGTTLSGGSYNWGAGTVFQINTDGTGLGVLHSFAGGPDDGAVACGSLTLSGTTLYGMTGGGGSSGMGVIFAIALNYPAVIAQTSSQTVVAGSPATFTVGTIAAAAPSYQWQRQAAGTATWSNLSEGAGYSGTNTVTLTVNPATLAMNGDLFQCVVSNSLGAVASSQATLSVRVLGNAVTITVQPANQSVVSGGSAMFSVTATGVLPPTYRWQRQAGGTTTWTNLTDGPNYSGATTATLTVNSITAAMSGDMFQCVVSNAYGDATSSSAALVVPVPLTVGTFAGHAGSSGSTDGGGNTSQFNGPADVAADVAGNIYVADTYNHTIRKITPAGVVSTVAGYTGASGSVDGTGAAARFNHPSGVTVDAAGNIFVADTDNQTIRKISPVGAVTTVAGQVGASGSVDGTGSAARFYGPSGLAVDAAGNIWVADTLNYTLRKITAAGVVNTFAGKAGEAGILNGTGTGARFFSLQGLVLDGGNLYVADTNNSTIRKVVLATGAVTTVAGLAGSAGSVDAIGSAARFSAPSAVAVDGAGNLYVADTDDCTLRLITPAGVVSTIAGNAGASGSADGVGTAARFSFPTGIAVDNAGNVYVADSDNQTIRLGYYPGAPAFTTQPQSQTIVAGTNVQFTVGTTGRPTPTLQWYFNGAAISGATGGSLSLTGVRSTNAGDYTVTATNGSGSVTSNKATLTVNAVPAVSTAPGGGGGGGGAMEWWFVLALLCGALGRKLAAQRRGKSKP